MLFEKTNVERFAFIRRVLENERFMRVKVFAKDPDQLSRKTMEIDQALKDLAEIEGASK